MSFPVRVVSPRHRVVGTFYVSDTSKVKDALNAAGITSINQDEEVFLNGKPAKLDEDLMAPIGGAPDKVEVVKKTSPIVTIIPKGGGAR